MAPKVGANPFAAAYFGKWIAVAGYDDQTIYFVNEQGVEKRVKQRKDRSNCLRGRI